MKRIYIISILIFTTFSLNSSLSFSKSRFQFDKTEYFKVFEKKPDSLEIYKTQKIKNPEDRMFCSQYWKVYYFKDKIVGEELYVKNNLVYYYIYYYDQQKIYQKGFYWHGIYRKIKYFKAHGKYIKQGWFYKNYPEIYRVFSKDGKLLYTHHYRDFES